MDIEDWDAQDWINVTIPTHRAWLTAPMYLDGLDGLGNSRLDRNIRYINYYRSIKSLLGFDYFVFIDNCSSKESMDKFLDAVGGPDLIIESFPHHIARGRGLDYECIWRAYWAYRTHIDHGLVSKLIFIDTDTFILSHKLANHIKNLQTGWEAMWCPRYGFPEININILNRDSFKIYMDFTKVDYKEKNGLLMEKTMPFTHVNKDFVIDRFGESKDKQRPDMDAYVQASLDIELVFEGTR